MGEEEKESDWGKIKILIKGVELITKKVNKVYAR